MTVPVSDYFVSDELIRSELAARLGIDNTPPFDVACTAILTARKMDICRKILGSPIHPTSWIRVLELNRALKSKDDSQHVRGEAVDFICPAFGSPYAVAKKLAESQAQLQFDQLILEFTWVHISFAITPARKPRGELLTLSKSGHYVSGLIEPKE